MTGDELRVEALGSLRAWLGDQELDLGPARQRAVFAALATRAVTQPVTRSELIQAVWGDAAPASANGSVHTYISGLRRGFDPSRTKWSTDGLLVSDSAGYRLRLDDDALDIRVFERHVGAARMLWQDGEIGQAVETLDLALAQWKGEALSGITGPYAESLRTNLTEQRVLALKMRAEGLLKLGLYEDLVPELTVLVREHPLREPLWRALMIALHRSGRTTEALETFRSAREVLRRELNTAPGRELVEAHRQILTDDPALAPSSPAVAPQEKLLSVFPAQVSHTIEERRTNPHSCHGREAELAILRRLADDVLNGHGRSAWIDGEPGIGKSELLSTALAGLGERGCHVAWGAAGELDRPSPLRVIMDALGLEIDETEARPPSANVDLPAATADRILAYIDELCATAPLLLVVDDLQWADEASVLMWNRLSTAARQLPLLLVATSRPVPRREKLEQVRRAAESRGLEVIKLEPLADADAEAVLADLLGALPSEQLRSLVPKAAGNPLYLRETTDALTHGRPLETIDGTSDTHSSVEAPESLLEAIARTLDMMDDHARETVRRAAVLGMEFGLTEVAATMDKMPSELLGAFEQVMEMRIIVETGTQLAFRHPMHRWALYNEIPIDMRADWHRRAAMALADIGSDVEQIAHQLVAVPTAIDDWVIDWLVEHHESLTNRSPLVAAELLRRSLDDFPTDDPRREVLLAAYVVVMVRLGQEPLELAMEAGSAPDRAAGSDDAPHTSQIWRRRSSFRLAEPTRCELCVAEREAKRLADVDGASERESYDFLLTDRFLRTRHHTGTVLRHLGVLAVSWDVHCASNRLHGVWAAARAPDIVAPRDRRSSSSAVERDIVELVTKGRIDAETAEAFLLSHRTVQGPRTEACFEVCPHRSPPGPLRAPSP
ncbi:hypothetical protein GCM10027598_58670 [Amycolatopsis oliviviridis]|uniref:OmpR/PhoB-type domain-containing protein n=1 Tax=Amycolatopsis oliviviridis TaxID=1471590 RepID=A0ABQ3M0J6_9PSEU|nr:BTAD domain-containing putative transcriptional regulator [Amycolatopsis oliviviridis]GHH28456.1 hypothetical protein GCM10017790_59320 [Amycolatopsis oliviviridis]